MLSPDRPVDLTEEDLERAARILQDAGEAGGGERPEGVHTHWGVVLELLRILREAVDAQREGEGDPPPLPTLGIFGDWGTGKSTALHWCEQALRYAGWPVIRFEAWRYQGDGDPMLALLEEVYQWSEGRSALRGRITRFIKRWEAVAAAGLFSVLGQLSQALLGADLSDPLRAMVQAGEGTGVSRSEYRKLRADLGTILSEIRRTSGGTPLVILVDDLDRCLPDRAWRILEVLRVHFLSPDAATILALEPDIMAAHIEKVYGLQLRESRGPVVDGQRFLDRVVSHGFRLRPLGFAEVAGRLKGASPEPYEPRLIEAVKKTAALGQVSWVPRIWVQLLNHLERDADAPTVNADDGLAPGLLLRLLLAVFRDRARPLSRVELEDRCAWVEGQREGSNPLPVGEVFRYDETEWNASSRLRGLAGVLRELRRDLE